MAVTGVNNYSNIYTNAYTGNIQKNNAKETTEKQHFMRRLHDYV